MAKVTFTDNSKLQERWERANEQAMLAVTAELMGRFDAALRARVWEWPRPTRRSNNKDVFTPRNIVDSGNLAQSGSSDLQGSVAFFRWSADYATAVHEGARIRPWGNRNAQLVDLPARPWTSAVMGDVQIAGIPVYDYKQAMFDKWLKTFKR